MLKYTFSKRKRLLSSRDFNFVFQKPKRVWTKQITILGRFSLCSYPRIGLIVSKKNIKYSHERNRIKRLIRESFRLYQNKLLAMDFIIIVKKGVDCFDNYILSEELKKLWSYYYH